MAGYLFDEKKNKGVSYEEEDEASDMHQGSHVFKIRGVCQKFPIRPKSLPFIKDLHFCSDQANIQPTCLAHEVFILTKFHEIRVKTVDFLVIANFWLSSKFSAYTPLLLPYTI